VVLPLLRLTTCRNAEAHKDADGNTLRPTCGCTSVVCDRPGPGICIITGSIVSFWAEGHAMLGAHQSSCAYVAAASRRTGETR
jgi:hypothetical protein